MKASESGCLPETTIELPAASAHFTLSSVVTWLFTETCRWPNIENNA